MCLNAGLMPVRLGKKASVLGAFSARAAGCLVVDVPTPLASVPSPINTPYPDTSTSPFARSDEFLRSVDGSPPSGGHRRERARHRGPGLLCAAHPRRKLSSEHVACR